MDATHTWQFLECGQKRSPPNGIQNEEVDESLNGLLWKAAEFLNSQMFVHDPFAIDRTVGSKVQGRKQVS